MIIPSSSAVDILSNFKNNIFVKACAGSGKTRLLAAKYLVAIFHFHSAQRLSAITFTEKAALELKSRIQKFLNILVESSSPSELELREDIPWLEIREAMARLGLRDSEAIRSLARSNKETPLSIGTIHSFAKKILDSYPLEILGGICSKFDGPGESLRGLLEEASSDMIAEELKDHKTFSFREALLLIQELLDCVKRGLEPGCQLKKPPSQELELIGLWRKFLSMVEEVILRSREEGYLDYDLMLYWLNGFLKSADPETLESIRERFRYILLDELQDTDFLQFEVLLKLRGSSRNEAGLPAGEAGFFMVGDPLQSIYAFRGTRPELGFQYAQKAGFLQYELLGNKRSGSQILKFINAVYSSERPMVSGGRQKNPDLVLWHSALAASVSGLTSEARRLDEARHVALTLSDLAKQYAWQWKDFAVLLRKMTHGWIYQEAFRELGIPTVLAASHAELCQRSLVVREIFWLMRLYLNLRDPLARLYLGHSPLKDKTVDFEDFYLKPIKVFRTGLWEKASSGAVVSKIKKSFSLEKKASQISFDETRALDFLEGLSWKEDLLDLEFFLKRLRALLERRELDDEELVSSEMPWEGNAVKILTIHKAKGLEFPCVVLAGLGDWSLRRDSKKILWDPQKQEAALRLSSMNVEKNEKEALERLEEESRVLYVALTRAERALVIFEPDLPKRQSGNSWTPKIKIALEKAKSESQPFECSLCHDPHAWKPQLDKGRGLSGFRPSHQPTGTQSLAPAILLASQETDFKESMSLSQEHHLGEEAPILGRIIHQVLEKIPWKAAIDDKDLGLFIREAFKNEEAFSSKPSKALIIEAEKILRGFLNSSLWRELVSKKLLLRETAVSYWQVPSLVVGRIDTLYEEDPQTIVIADYKTEAPDPQIYLNQGKIYLEAFKNWKTKRGYEKACFEIIDLKLSKRTRLL